VIADLEAKREAEKERVAEMEAEKGNVLLVLLLIEEIEVVLIEIGVVQMSEH